MAATCDKENRGQKWRLNKNKIYLDLRGRHPSFAFWLLLLLLLLLLLRPFGLRFDFDMNGSKSSW
jgi:hypothetical protein